MSTPIQKTNLEELLGALLSIRTGNLDQSPLSRELEMLIEQGVHQTNLPHPLHTSAAEAFQLAFEAWGGLPRLLLFADRYPGSFLKLYARQTAPTITPVLPKAEAIQQIDDWPPWMTSRRLAYQEGPASTTEAPTDDDDA